MSAALTEATADLSPGIAALARGDWAQARSLLQDSGGRDDADPVLQLNLALAEDRLAPERGRAIMHALAATYPDWDEPNLRLAESHRRENDAAEAVRHYQAALAINPDRVEALLGLGVLHVLRGEAAEARLPLLQCCGLDPQNGQAWDALGIALSLLGEHGKAEASFARAQRLLPDHLPVALRRVGAAVASGAAEAELARLQAALAAEPADLCLLTARGVLLDRLGRAEEAVELLDVAVALYPEEKLPAAALAVSLVHAGRFPAAVPALRHAVALSPDAAALHNDLGACLNRLHRYREAREVLEAARIRFGDNYALLCNLCNALVSLGLQREGVAVATEATRIAPEMPLPWRTLATALVYVEGDVSDRLRTAAANAAAAQPRGPDPAPPRASWPERRLRVGLLSAMLRTHPVGWLTVAGFEALDRTQFELVCFAQPPSEDTLQRRFQAAASGWHSVTRSGPADIAALIREQRIDILIELGGWGDQGLIAACARRPAPVQIKWVGMQNASTGMDEIDWMISDRWETPDGFDSLYTERLLRLPDGYVCYSPSALAPDVAPAPSARTGRITFGCFNNLAKITPEVIACWSDILSRVPESALILKAHQFSDAPTCAAMRERFAAHGVDPARIETRGSSTHRSQLLQHADVDLILDPFPYSGGLTTCEALWMGVPVVTLPSQTFASRHSTSHVSNVGLADWVARDVQDYQDIAVARAADRPGLHALRAGLREQMRASPLCDTRRFGASLGAALRHAWRAACAA